MIKMNIAAEHHVVAWTQYARALCSSLISFGEPRAIPLAVKRATESDLCRRTDMLNFLVEVKASAIAPAFVAVLESRVVLGGNPSDLGTDGNIRGDIMKCLGRPQAREGIPVLRAYVRRKDSNMFLQRIAVMTLGVLALEKLSTICCRCWTNG